MEGRLPGLLGRLASGAKWRQRGPIRGGEAPSLVGILIALTTRMDRACASRGANLDTIIINTIDPALHVGKTKGGGSNRGYYYDCDGSSVCSAPLRAGLVQHTPYYGVGEA